MNTNCRELPMNYQKLLFAICVETKTTCFATVQWLPDVQATVGAEQRFCPQQRISGICRNLK